MTDKPIRWIGSSLSDLTNFPDAARKKAVFQKKTSKLDLEIGQKRYQQMLQYRKSDQE